MVYDKARELAAAMAESEEYVTFKNAKERLLPTTPRRLCSRSMPSCA